MAILYRDLLPFKLDFITQSNRRLPVDTFWTQLIDIQRDEFLEIHENVSIGLQFNEQTTSELLNGTLEIETSRYNDQGDMEPFVFALDIDSTYELFRNHWSENKTETNSEDEFPWRMGYYLIKLNYNGEVYFSGLKVIPNNMSSEEVKRLQTYLENQVEGICHDLILSQQGFTEEENSRPDYMNYMLFLYDYRIEIISLIHQILRNPIEEIETSYKISPHEGRQTTKSHRWTQTAKGMAHNGGFFPQPFSLIAKKQLNLNNTMNQWIKHILIQWRQDIDLVSRLVNDDLERLIHQENQQRILMETAQTELDRVRLARDMLYVQQKQYKQAFYRSETRLKKINQELLICNERVKVLEGLSRRMSFILAHPEFADVSISVGKPVLKNRAYFRFDQLYGLSKQVRKKEGEQRRYKPVLKRTWQLYEYFVLMQIIDILRSEGFRFIEGFDQPELDSYLVKGIAEGSRFVLESDKVLIHIWYDKLLPLTIEDAKRTGEEFYIPTDHRKPDIRIDLYNKLGNNEIQLSSCFIVEVKDSKLRNLYKKNFNRVRSQLSAYQSVYYCGPHTGGNLELKMAPVVKRVFCVHAGEGEGANAIAIRQPHMFLRLCPVIGESDDISVFGLPELAEALSLWMDRSKIEVHH